MGAQDYILFGATQGLVSGRRKAGRSGTEAKTCLHGARVSRLAIAPCCGASIATQRRPRTEPPCWFLKIIVFVFLLLFKIPLLREKNEFFLCVRRAVHLKETVCKRKHVQEFGTLTSAPFFWRVYLSLNSQGPDGGDSLRVHAEFGAGRGNGSCRWLQRSTGAQVLLPVRPVCFRGGRVVVCLSLVLEPI